MRRLLVVALLALLAGCGPAPVHLEEDDPGWDCHTMGNLICGPGAE